VDTIAPARSDASTLRAGGGVRPRAAIRRLLLHALLVVAVGIAALPLLWMLLSSLKPDSENTAYPPTIVPRTWTLASYGALFNVSDFGSYLRNSSVLAISTTALTLVLATLTAYAITRFRLPGLRLTGELALFAYMIPPILLLVPIARIVTGLGLANTATALVLVYTSHLVPFALWILRAHFQAIPVELEHAAMVDGCTRFGAFLRVIIPQATPGLISTGIFTFNAAWAEYLYASTLLNSGNKMPLAAGLALLMDQTGVYSWGMLMAASALVTLPVIALFLVAQKQLVSTWSEGAVKA
jgi:multiple sugar transport system permease protein